MGFGQTMDLIFIKKYKVIRQKNDGYWTNYGFEINNEIKDLRQKKDGGSRTMDLDLQKKWKELRHKNHGVWTNYGFDIYNEI